MANHYLYKVTCKTSGKFFVGRSSSSKCWSHIRNSAFNDSYTRYHSPSRRAMRAKAKDVYDIDKHFEFSYLSTATDSTDAEHQVAKFYQDNKDNPLIWPKD